MKRIIQLFLILAACNTFAASFKYKEFVDNGGFESSTSSNPLGGDYTLKSSHGESFSLETSDTFRGSKALRLRRSSSKRDKTTKLTINSDGNVFFDPPLSDLDERLFKCHVAAKLKSSMKIQDETPFFMRVETHDTNGKKTIFFVRVPYEQGQWSEYTRYILVPKNTRRFYVTIHVKFATDILIDDISIRNAFLDSTLDDRVYRTGETLDMTHKVLTPNGESLSSVRGAMTIDTVEVDLDSRGRARDVSEIIFAQTGVAPRSDGKMVFSSVNLSSSKYPADHIYRVTVDISGNGSNETRESYFLVTQNTKIPRYYWDLDRSGSKERRFPIGFYSIQNDDAFPLQDIDWVDFLRATRTLYKETDKSGFGMYLFPSFHYFERFIFEEDLMLDSKNRLVDNKDNRWAGGIDIGGEPSDDGINPERSAWAYNLGKSFIPNRPVNQMVHHLEDFEIGLFGDAMTLWPNFKGDEGGFSPANFRAEVVNKMAAARAFTDGRIPIFGLVPVNFLKDDSDDNKPKPSLNEFRCVSVLFLALDANGLMFNADNQNYIFDGGSNGSLRSFEDDAPDLFNLIMKVGETVDDMRSAMLGSKVSSVKIISGSTSDVKFIAKDDSTHLYIAVANYSSSSKSLVFSLGSTSSQGYESSARELLRNKSATVSTSGGEYLLNVSISREDGHIYRIPKVTGGGTPPPPSSGELAAHWDMEEGSGPTAFDMSGNGNHVSITQAKWATTKIGNFSLRFDGNNDYAKAQDSSSLDASSAITLSAWIYPDNLAGGKPYPAILSKSSAYRLYVHTDKKVRFQIYDGSKSIVDKPSTTIPNLKWTHIASTFDGSRLRVYINGELKKTVSYSGSINVNKNSVFLGARNEGKDFFDGKIDDVRIYDEALSAQEILDIFNQR